MTEYREEITDGVGDPQAATQQFFESKKAAAILKHAILSRYLRPFVSKTGKYSADHRVVIVDGYAGDGRYESGQPGSPMIIADAAKALPFRKVLGLFVESDPETYERLRDVLTEVADGNMEWEAYQGSADEHLPTLLSRAQGVPLLLFLDPYGAGLPPSEILDIFKARAAGHRAPATEVLFRFDANLVRRTRGYLSSHKEFPGKATGLAKLDLAAGGSWWRDKNNPSLDNEQYLDWFFERLLHNMCASGKCSGWNAEVKERDDLQPAYYLIFLTRHPDGMEEFAEALSNAQQEWRRAVFDISTAKLTKNGQGLLIDVDSWFEERETALVNRWQAEIEANLRALLEKHPTFIVRSKLREVFGASLGLARTKHLRAALKRLHADGVTSSDSKGDLWPKTVIRASNQTG